MNKNTNTLHSHNLAHFGWWGKVALISVSVIILIAIFAPILVPYEPDMQDLSAMLAPMSAEHWLGTDYLGRDIFSRILYGASISLGCTFVILAWIVVLGVSVGGLCGFIGGRIDTLCMRVCDVFMSMPTIALSLFLIGMLGVGLENVMIAIIATHWAWYARIVRSIVFNLKNKEFVTLSYTFGANGWQRFKRHLLVPIFSQCAVIASMDIGHIMLHIAGLSFLGLGVQPPIPEWGIMLNEAKDYMWDYPMLILYPGLALFVSVASCNLLGEALRDYFGVQNMLNDLNKKYERVKDSKQILSKNISLSNVQTLQVRDLHICMDSTPLISHLNLKIKSGECVALLGKSGSGKSISALALQGFLASNLTQTSGEIMLDNEVINPQYYRSLAFASIMQNPRTCFNPLLSIHYHFKETLQALHKPYDKSFILQCLQESGFNTQASHIQTKSYAQYVLDSYPFELSGGMLQRVMIALALLTQAPFIIADEPTSDLDRDVAFEILETLHTLQMQKKIGILLITHDLEVVANMAQYVYVVDKGKIVEDMALDKDFYLYTPKTPTTKHLKDIYTSKEKSYVKTL